MLIASRKFKRPLFIIGLILLLLIRYDNLLSYQYNNIENIAGATNIKTPIQDYLDAFERTEIFAHDDSLIREGIKFLREGIKDSKPETSVKKALSIFKKSLGPEHPLVGIAMVELASFYSKRIIYRKADPLFKEALSIFEKSLGYEHPLVAIAMSEHASLYAARIDFKTAELLFKKALSINQKANGIDHPETVAAIKSLANLYIKFSRHEKAESLYKQFSSVESKSVEQIREELKAESLVKINKQEEMLKEPVTTIEKEYGLMHKGLPIFLERLAKFYEDNGRYDEAISLVNRSLSIRKKYSQIDYSMNTSIFLARLYIQIGSYDESIKMLKNILSIYEKEHGLDSVYSAYVLAALGMLHTSTGLYPEAEKYFKKALSIYKKNPSAHPHKNLTEFLLAELYIELGDFSKAELLIKKISEQAIEKLNNKDYGTPPPITQILQVDSKRIEMARANIYYGTGKYLEAESLYMRLLSKNEYGIEGPNSSVIRNKIACLNAKLGNDLKALKFFKDAVKQDDILLDLFIDSSFEQEKLKYAFLKKRALDNLTNHVYQRFCNNEEIVKELLNLWLNRKGMVFETNRHFWQTLMSSENKDVINILSELSLIRSSLSRLIFSSNVKGDDIDRKKEIKNLIEAKELLLEKLWGTGEKNITKINREQIDIKGVTKALPANTVLFEFVKINSIDFKKKSSGPPIYIVFIVQSKKDDSKVKMINIGNAEIIDQTILNFKKEIQRKNNILKKNGADRDLYKILFEPLEKEIGSANNIFISPDGSINLLPFETLRDAKGNFLIEKYTFNYVSDSKNIPYFGQGNEKGGKSLIMGNPNFDMSNGMKISSLRELGINDNGKARKNIHKRSSDLNLFGKWSSLPSTEEEVETIHSLLGENNSSLYTGNKALEEVLLTWSKPTILHLATHGFFLEDNDILATKKDHFDRGVVNTLPYDNQTLHGLNKDYFIENPLLRSGFILAGANQRLKEEGISLSDGIMTAEKILGLNLNGTELVVLSACDTGLGTIEVGEGVFGLRRAFTMAGAKSLVMSMWKVPDKETKELMIDFYKNLLSGKMDRCQALRQAALNELKIVEKRYGTANPLYWGGFVFLGDPFKEIQPQSP